MPLIDRRGVIRASTAALVAAPAATLARPAVAQSEAAAPLQGAGFYRFAMGDKTLTVLASGWSRFPGAEMFAVNVEPAEFEATQAHLFEPTDGVEFHMNQLLVETGDRRILIDAGPGHFLGADFDRQGLALANAGIDPATIDTVVITHGHPDHFAGLLDAAGALRFPNARIVWDAREHAFWTSEEAATALRNSALPQGFIDTFLATAQTVLPATAAQNDFVEGESEIAPGVMLLEAPGHTPHSAVVLIAGGDQQLLYGSDTTLLPAQNALRPEWVSAFELDGPALVEARLRLLDRAASDGLLWHGYHAAFPALGHIRRAADAYEWVPDAWLW